MAGNDQKGRYRDISEGLLRQRRNLLLVSLLLPLFFSKGAVIDELNVLGTTIHIQEPGMFKTALIVIFSYFFLRYWQYYREETFVQDMYKTIAANLYKIEIDFLHKRAKVMANFVHPFELGVTLGNPRYRGNSWPIAIPELKETPTFPFFRKCEVYIYPAPGKDRKQPDIHAFDKEMRKHENWHCIRDEHNQPKFYREYVHYCVFRFYLMRIIGFFRFMLNESYFTDYQLPFIVAAISILATFYATWF